MLELKHLRNRMCENQNCGCMKMETGCLLLLPKDLFLAGGKPLPGGGGLWLLESPSCPVPALARQGRRGTSACVWWGWRPTSPKPPPPLLFIAFHQHLEFEPARRWLAPAGGWSWGRRVRPTGREGGREGMSPEPSPAACEGAAASQCGTEDHPGFGMSQEHPCSAFPALGMA